MKSQRWWHETLKCHHGRHHHHRHHGRLPFSVWLVIGNNAVELPPNQETFLMSQLHVDNIMNYAITAADSAGDPISPITFDAAPAWTSSNPAAGTIAASADGTTAVLTPAAAPASVSQVTVVSMTCSIGGVTFTASDTVTIVAGAVASVSIVGTPAPIPAPAPAPAPAGP